MGSYLHPNVVKNAKFRGLRRIRGVLPTLRGVIICRRVNLASKLGCLVGNKSRCLMNMGMSASTIRMPFLSKNFNFLKKVSTKREGLRKFFYSYFPLPFQITTTNNKDKRIGIVQSVLSVVVTSVFSDWLTSPLLFCSLYICDTTRMVWADQ